MALPSEPAALTLEPALRPILESAGVWLWECDLVADTTVYQKGFWEHFGYDPEQFSETFDFIQAVHSSDRNALARAWRQHIEGETPSYGAEWRLRTASGDWRWIASCAQVTRRDAAGIPLHIMGSYRDITDERSARRDSRPPHAELDALFQKAREGMIFVSPELTLLRANDAAIDTIERITGHRLERGESLLRLPNTSPEGPVLGGIKVALGGQDFANERSFSVDERTSWLEFSYSTLRRNDGTVLGAAVTVRDVTERKRQDNARNRGLRMESLGLMAGGIAHDFNNLLTAIIANIDVAGQGEIEPNGRLSLNEARQAAERAAELVVQLLSFAGRRTGAPEPVDLSALTGEIVRYARKMPGANAVIEEHLARGLPAVSADATQIRQVVMNLLVNAVDATREHGSRVVVKTFATEDPAGVLTDPVLPVRTEGQFVILRVSDDGEGMDHETRDRIFEPLFTTKPGGHGLGLPSVLGIVKSHGGGMSVESEPGKGATFTVALPAA